MSSDKSYSSEQRLTALVGNQPQVGFNANSSGQLINSLTPATVASRSSVPAGNFAVLGQIIYVPTTSSAGAAVFSWAGTLTTSTIRIRMWEWRGYPNSFGTSAVPVLNGAGFTNMTNSYTTGTFGSNTVWTVIDISGVVTCTVAGSLALQAACTNASDTFTVEFGTDFVLIPSW